jgi:hypothetical protein
LFVKTLTFRQRGGDLSSGHGISLRQRFQVEEEAPPPPPPPPLPPPPLTRPPAISVLFEPQFQFLQWL